MTPTEAPLRRALSTMAEQVEVVDLAGRVDAQLRRRRRRAQVAALLAAACVASVVTGVLLQTRDDERALPTQPGPSGPAGPRSGWATPSRRAWWSRATTWGAGR